MTSDRGNSGGAELELNNTPVESNYETLRLNTQIETAAFLGRRFFPTPSCHDGKKKGTPVIDYFDYVNPSDVDENERVDKIENELEADGKGFSNEKPRHTAKVGLELEEEHKNAKKAVLNRNGDSEGTGSADIVEDGIVKKITAETKEIPTAEISNTAEETEKSGDDSSKKHSQDELNHSNVKGSGLKVKKLRKLELKRKNKQPKKDEKLEEAKKDVLKKCVEDDSNKTESVTQEKKLIQTDLEDCAESCIAVDVTQIDSTIAVNNEESTKSEGEKEELEVRVSSLHKELTYKPEYRTALQVDTSYQAGVSSDSNCSQYSASSWTSEHDTSSSLDPSPNLWNSYIDSGVSLGTSTGGIYSDTSDVSGEDCCYYDNSNNQRYHSDLQHPTESKYVQIRTFYPRHKFCYSDSYSNGAIQNNGAFPNVNIYSESSGVTALDYEGYRNYSGPVSGGAGEINCDYCQYCACSEYEGCPQEPMLPGDVFYYSSNSVVLCVKQNKQQERRKQVTPKSPALNPNATVFLSVKSCTPTAGPTDTGQFEANDSGIASTSNSTSDYSYVNGDISTDKVDTVIFSPTSDSPFQSEFAPYTDNHSFNENNSVAMKLDESMGNMVLDGGGYGVDTTAAPAGNFSGEGVPMTGIQYSSENGSATDGETEGNVTDDQLKQVLKSHLESYFSRENLSNDSYLQSQMDADQYVPIATVASLDQIQKLSSDLKLIVQLLRESTFVQVDEKGEKVRPNHNRCIVILREIPESTPVQDVQGLFSGDNCPKFVSCEFAHNSNWYVTFDSDADAQRAYQYLREEVRTFLGKPIMARIKAKPLIRTYQPRNMNKRFQQPPVSSQIPAEVVASSAPQPQFTATQPFTLMPNMSQYLNGQQAIPFYPPPPSQLLQAYPTIMDPSMVLAMNGYQATSVNVNSQVNNRNMFNAVSRTNNNNTRNQKQHGGGGQPIGRDRINSNDSLPPRLQHQQHERQNANNNMHKTSQPISNHAPNYQGRRGDGLGQGHSSHSNHSHHSHHGNHSHPGHSSQMSHHQHPPQSMHHHQGHHIHQQSQHLDGNNNNSSGAMMNSRNTQGVDLSQRYAGGKSYKSRRRREEDGARPNRSNSSQLSSRDGQPMNQARSASVDKFDYEPTSFPPLPGSGNNASSGDVFESKLSDVVKGTAKPQVKDVPKPVSSVMSVSTATTTVTTSKTSMSSSHDDETTPTSTSHQSSSSSTPLSKTGSGATSQQPTVSQQVRSSVSTVQTVPDGRAGRDQDAKSGKESNAHAGLETDTQPDKERQQNQQQQSNTDDTTASLCANSFKLSYAQMVQKPKVAEVSANSLADPSDESDSEGNDTSQAPNRALKEKGQHPAQSSSKPSARGSVKDFSRKDSRENDGDSRRDEREFRKENNYRRDEPREQRMNTRRLKENRERRYADRDRDFGHRNDHRVRDGPPMRERENARPAAAAAK